MQHYALRAGLGAQILPPSSAQTFSARSRTGLFWPSRPARRLSSAAAAAAASARGAGEDNCASRPPRPPSRGGAGGSGRATGGDRPPLPGRPPGARRGGTCGPCPARSPEAFARAAGTGPRATEAVHGNPSVHGQAQGEEEEEEEEAEGEEGEQERERAALAGESRRAGSRLQPLATPRGQHEHPAPHRRAKQTT
ncbi:unnamed protein product [Prorocentrum cordatum]|uniref:Uncharacterized protein n=1 Tax=Prorocentrum cordatum TaxID=2364126 RepID=A0ABN9TAU3_9DINO|nr:unnamed protein product [Polarella glacialis]